MIPKHQFEAQIQQIFRMLLDNKTEEQIANELHISVRTVQRYKQRLDKRYGDAQRKKTDNTLFMECNFFKHRFLTLYKRLEATVTSDNDKTSGTDKAKCAEVAANIAIDVLKMESEGIKAVKELVAKNTQGKNILDSITTVNLKMDMIMMILI